MHRVVLAAALVATVIAAVAAASNFTATPPVVASAASPFAGCTNIGPGTPGAVNYVNAEVEPWVDVNPTNPNNIIAVWQQDRWSDGGARGLVAGVSQDGGLTWTRSWAPFTFCSGGNAGNGGDFERASDPWVTFSPNGSAYQIAINFNGLDLTNAVTVSKSTNGGLTWSPLKTLIRDSGERDSSWAFNDKQSITADPFDSRYVYAVWDRLVSPNGKSKASFQGLLNSKTFRGPTWFSRTTDGGQTWEPARIISDPGSHNQTIANQIDVLPNGTLLDLFTQFVEHKNAKGIRGVHYAVIRSTDKGASWSDEIVIAPDNSVGVSDPDTGQPLRVGDIIPDIAVNRHPGTPGFGNAYVVFEGRSSPSATSDDAIFLAVGTNGGQDWSDPIQVDKTPAGVAAFTPSVHVAADGTVAVTYFDLRNNTSDPATLPTDYFIVHSHDGGLTFGNELKLTPTSFDSKTAPFARGFFLGDYMGLANIGNTFTPVWVGANSGNTTNRTDVFFAKAGP